MTVPLRPLLIAAVLANAAAATASPFADRVIYNWDGATATYAAGTNDNMTYGPFHSNTLWKNPDALLGKPNVVDKDDTVWSATSCEFREINVVWPAWYQGSTQASAANTLYAANPTGAVKENNGVGLVPKKVSGAMTYPQIVVEFDEPITDDPANPYGIDVIVHGNAFFSTGKMVYKNSNMNEYTLTAFGGGGDFGASGAGSVFEERVTVSVAQSLNGPWYNFETAFGDWFFPTQPLAWDRTKINENLGTGRTSIYGDWTDQENDWSKPVNPALLDLASEAAQAGSGAWGYFGNRTVADALDLYAGSAGGTGFDLSGSGFEWIKYVKFTDPNNKQGEICGVVDVAPVTVGDRLTMTWHNVHETGQNTLFFQDPSDPSVNLAEVAFNDIDQVSYVSVSEASDLSAYGSIPAMLASVYQVSVDEVFPTEGTVSFDADLSLLVSDAYGGDGSDLRFLSWNGSTWDFLADAVYDPATRMMTLAGLTSSATFALGQQVPEPGTLVLAGLAACGLAAFRRRSSKRWASRQWLPGKGD
jgi:hypothetical protein